jgi:hypothetical protein
LWLAASAGGLVTRSEAERFEPATFRMPTQPRPFEAFVIAHSGGGPMSHFVAFQRAPRARTDSPSRPRALTMEGRHRDFLDLGRLLPPGPMVQAVLDLAYGPWS